MWFSASLVAKVHLPMIQLSDTCCPASLCWKWFFHCTLMFFQRKSPSSDLLQWNQISSSAFLSFAIITSHHSHTVLPWAVNTYHHSVCLHCECSICWPRAVHHSSLAVRLRQLLLTHCPLTTHLACSIPPAVPADFSTQFRTLFSRAAHSPPAARKHFLLTSSTAHPSLLSP